ncbi:hypothetical protein [Aquisalimonas sp.]|uniref:hypothetical protein n=1 Tax=Aquisalimonas sp. TaxID=1872621 RepID=UPI0025BED782|nr:hypothetical protein [Aquisalimonas sp.]
MAEIYWEDQAVGSVREFGGMTVDRERMLAFASEYDARPATLGWSADWPEVDDDRPVSSGLHVAALCMRMMVDHVLGNSSSLGSPGIQRLRWLNTVRAGDTLWVRQCVLAKHRHPRRRDVGFINNRTEVLNQDGLVVMYMDSAGMFRLRAPQAAESGGDA